MGRIKIQPEIEITYSHEDEQYRNHQHGGPSILSFLANTETALH